jgi:hypothetical protein
MAALLSLSAHRPRRRRPAFLILASVVVVAVAAYGLLLNSGWPA